MMGAYETRYEGPDWKRFQWLAQLCPFGNLENPETTQTKGPARGAPGLCVQRLAEDQPAEGVWVGAFTLGDSPVGGLVGWPSGVVGASAAGGVMASPSNSAATCA